MKILKDKWTWILPYGGYLEWDNTVCPFVSPGADYVGQNDGFTVSFRYFASKGDFGDRRFKKKFRTWNEAHQAGERALRFINRIKP
jgi:hypothetical protein